MLKAVYYAEIYKVLYMYVFRPIYLFVLNMIVKCFCGRQGDFQEENLVEYSVCFDLQT